MASILRSSKFARYIAGFARNIVVNTPREFDGSVINNSQCFCGAIPRSLATQAVAQHDQNLERRLRSLDQDVRRSGRISRRDIEDVLEEIRSSRSATSSQSLLVIRCCGNLVPEEVPEIRTKLVQEIWNTLKKLNVPMDISHYNALLRVYLENEHEFSPTEFLTELESKGLEPNRVTYQRLISRYCQIGDIEGATKILEFMREKQLPVNENVFNALIMGHSQSGDMESAKGILNVMTQAGLEPSADTYTTLLCGYAAKGDMDAIKKTVDECAQKDVHLLDKDFLDIVYSLASNGHGKYVPQILENTKRQIGYSQDAINLILRLINKGQVDVAYAVLKTIPRGSNEDGDLMPLGAFFIKQLVKANHPFETIVKYSEVLKNEGFYEKGLLLATEVGLESGNENLAFPLMDELQKNGTPIRQHFFWPLLAAQNNDNTGNGIIRVLSQMSKYNLAPTSETIRDYVIPNMQGKSSDVIAKLREANISVGQSAASLVQRLIQKQDLKEAALIISTIPAYHTPELIRRLLTNAFYATEDVDSYVTIIRYVVEYSDRLDSLRGPKEEKIDILGSFIIDLSSFRKFPEIVEKVCDKLLSYGLSLPTKAAERIQEKLGENMTSKTNDLLEKLTSGELKPIPITKSKLPAYTPYNQMNIPQLEQLIKNLDAKKQDTKGFKRHLLTLYYQAKELEKMESLTKNLSEDPEFKYTSGIYAQMMDVYSYHNKPEEAKNCMKKMQELEPDRAIDDSKILRYSLCLIKSDQFDKAIEVLTDPNLKRRNEQKSVGYNGLCWTILNHLAEAGQAEKLQKLFNVLHQNNYIEVNNILLGSLVKVHIINKDLDKALEAFEWCASQFKATPWKGELTCQLIQIEDAERLQRVTDLSTSVHGEINSLYDLVFAFVECGRIRQARKILETPGLQNRPQKIQNVCERYQVEGLVKPLEGLKDATKDLSHIDRSNIYYQLLLSYIKQEETEKAIGLWTQMQEEDILASDKFLHVLGNYLKQKNLNVPFAIPQQEETNVVKQERTSTTSVTKRIKKDVINFRQQINSGNVTEAFNIYKQTKESLSLNDLSALLEKLVQQDHLSDANKLCMDMLEKQQIPLPRVFRYFLNKLAGNGEVETLEKIGSKLDQEMKKIVSLDNRICHANLVAGKAEDYLNMLEKEIDQATPESLAQISEKFPRGGAVGILEKHPELTEKYEQIAQKYSKHKIIAPYNVLWAQYFIKGNDEKAEQIWKDYLQGAPRIMFQRVVQAARDNQDVVLIKKLIDHLKTSKVTEGALGNAYSCLLDVVVAKGDKDEVISTFEATVKEIPIESINRTAVLRVKDIYTSQEKPFIHKIPLKSKGNISSSQEDQKR
ncbi:leucine-rich PPR motif-containing protein, mitochondrial [Onthophagus taurus]|uniref:leucine-rich PPR motif-containing protein, mitochondrial n=1 Tax=Onthophagus taurus TaxID=166361 RepID=UPI0039BE897F